MSQITSAGQQSTLTAIFEDRDDAQDAVDRLVAAGIPQSSIRLMPGYERDSGTTTTSTEHVHKGFFESLADFFMPDEDRYTYAEGLARGGYLVTVSSIPTGLYDTALDILDDEGAIDLDAAEQTWRSEGWSGYAGSSTASGGSSFGSSTSGSSSYGTSGTASSYTTDTVAPGSGFGADPVSQTGSGSSSYGNSTDNLGLSAGSAAGVTGSSTLGSTSSDYASDRTTSYGNEEVIPVVEEQLKVGKRDVNLGRVRVRSYVREEPVSADVNLRDERVYVETRAVDRPLTGNEAVFQDRTIEAEEHAEEAVVAKEARVTGEVSLRKEEVSRQETISDTVRKTEVEVEDDRDTLNRTGSTGTFNQ